jgi:hypothetical protein
MHIKNGGVSFVSMAFLFACSFTPALLTVLTDMEGRRTEQGKKKKGVSIPR